MKIKPSAILFDMDGVLIDSIDAWWRYLNTSLEAFKYEIISKEEFKIKYWGHDLYDNLKTMKIPLKVGKFCNNVYGNHVDEIKIFPETKKTLKKLNSYRKSIITNTPNDCTKQILKKFKIENYFEFILTSDNVKIAKPNPEIVIKSCELLKINPYDAILVGDTESDVMAGKAAGCTVVGVNIDADYTIKKISELIEILE
jgi:HAD superfamily hydrolase (TIGR01509 family)